MCCLIYSVKLYILLEKMRKSAGRRSQRLVFMACAVLYSHHHTTRTRDASVQWIQARCVQSYICIQLAGNSLSFTRSSCLVQKQWNEINSLSFVFCFLALLLYSAEIRKQETSLPLFTTGRGLLPSTPSSHLFLT